MANPHTNKTEKSIGMIGLVGPGGAGKSTAGAILARRLGVSLIDLDEEFIENVGDISLYIGDHGYDAYCERNVNVYLKATRLIESNAVLVLSSGFMTYRSDIHPEYKSCLQDIATGTLTFVLLPSLDFEVCVAETVRRQRLRSFARSEQHEEEVIRNRFSVYANIPAKKVETMCTVEEVVDQLVNEIAGASNGQ
ncbi:MAG: shikimate kinase [Planctomycetota bacterium]